MDSFLFVYKFVKLGRYTPRVKMCLCFFWRKKFDKKLNAILMRRTKSWGKNRHFKVNSLDCYLWKTSRSRAPGKGTIHFRPCITAPQRHLHSTSKEYNHEGNWCKNGRCTFNIFTICRILSWRSPHYTVIVASRQRQLFSHSVALMGRMW